MNTTLKICTLKQWVLLTLLVMACLPWTHALSQTTAVPSAEEMIERLSTGRSRGMGTANSRNLVVVPMVPSVPIETVSLPAPTVPISVPISVSTSIATSTTAPSIAVTQPSVIADKPSIDLDIRFDVNSAAIRNESKEVLSNLQRAMQSEALKALRFVIEGHTDVSGRADTNLKLSQARADAVRTMLVLAGINQDRLKSMGKGSTEPVNKTNRFASENRRVRILSE